MKPSKPKTKTRSAKQVAAYRAVFRQLETTLQSYVDILKKEKIIVRSISWNHMKMFRKNGTRHHVNVTVFGDSGQIPLED